MNNNCCHHLTFVELGDLINQPPELLERLCRCGIHPPWIWREHWREPRFQMETLPEWLRILDAVDLDDLDENPPPLEHPLDVFQPEQNGPDPDLELILKHFPAKTAARLRADRTNHA